MPDLDPGVMGGTPTNPEYYLKYSIEPLEFIFQNDIPFAEATIIKYLVRWRDKNGVEDLKKARVYLDRLIKHHDKRWYIKEPKNESPETFH
tara:strand:+ start:121 stop:393 length:273 start_codon:yes stop_codon:yes gene_type:complete